MKSVETAYNYAKNNCGLVVDVSSSGAQITRAYTSVYTSGCRPLRELCTTQRVRQLPKIRCNRCKKYRGAVNGPAVFGVVQAQQTQHSCSL